MLESLETGFYKIDPMEDDWYLGDDEWIIKQTKVIRFIYLSGYCLIKEKTEKASFSWKGFVEEIAYTFLLLLLLLLLLFIYATLSIKIYIRSISQTKGFRGKGKC